MRPNPSQKTEKLPLLAIDLLHKEGAVRDTIQKLLYLEEEMARPHLWKMFGEVVDLMLSALVVASSYLISRSLSILGFYIMNHFQQTNLQAAFSIYNLTRYMVSTSCAHAISMKMSMKATLSFGQGDMPIGKRYLTQAFLIYGLGLCSIYMPVLFFMKDLFPLMGLSNSLTEDCLVLSLKNLASDMFEGSRSIITDYCFSQKIEKEIAVTSWINFVVSIVATLVLSFTYDLKFDGWIIGRTLFSTLNFTAALIIYFVRVDPQSKGLCSVSEAFIELQEFCCDSLSFWVANLFEWIGWQIGLYYNALSQDINQIAAVGSVMNLAYFLFDVGNGCLVVGRTRMNYLIGAGYHHGAKKLTALLILASFLVGIGLGLLIFAFRNSLAAIFSSENPTERGYLLRLIALYCLFLNIDINYKIISGLCRMTNNMIFMVCSFSLFPVAMNGVVCWYMHSHMQVDCTAIFTCMYGSIAAALLLINPKIFLSDWSRLI